VIAGIKQALKICHVIYHM